MRADIPIIWKQNSGTGRIRQTAAEILQKAEKMPEAARKAPEAVGERQKRAKNPQRTGSRIGRSN